MILVLLPMLPILQALPSAAEQSPAWNEAMLRLLAATAAGGLLGLNRELTQKPAGLRTHALVALRVIQGIIAGIGFLGGGVILHTEGRNVSGLTTAATIWVAAALGISCGIGQWHIAGMTAGLALIVLVAGRPIEDLLHRYKRNDEPTPPEKDK